MKAALSGDVAAVSSTVAAGQNVDARFGWHRIYGGQPCHDSQNRPAETALMIAAKKGHMEVCIRLVELGATLNLATKEQVR